MKYIDKLPTSLVNMLKEKRDINYNPQYNEELPLKEQNIRQETMAMITLLYLNYWCEDENEKAEITQLLKNNEEKYQLELREKYNPDNMFKNHNNTTVVDNSQNVQEVALVEISNEKWYEKIWNKIKNLLRKKRG